MVTWSDVRRWDRYPVFEAIYAAQDRRQRAEDLSTEFFRAGHFFQAEGASADAIRAFISEQSRTCDRLVDQYAELMMASAQAGDSVAHVQGRVEECLEFAEIERLLIAEDGTVSISPERQAECMNPEILDSERQKLQTVAGQARETLHEMIADLLLYADEVDAVYSDRLAVVAAGGPYSGEGRGSASQGLPDLPDPSWSEAEVAAWWASNSPEDRQLLIEQHPDVIGNTNGIDATSRDQANQNYAEQLAREAAAELERLEEQDPGNRDPNFAARREELKQLLADLQQIQTTLARTEDAQLLVLDLNDGKTRAAISSGNIDTAAYVAVYAPGLGSTVQDSLQTHVDRAAALRDAAQSEHGADPDEVAIVTWLGYDPPPSSGIGVATAAEPGQAFEGGQLMRDFMEGIHAFRQGSAAGDPYLSALGHSYGSTTMGFMADQVNPGVVDDVVFLGSPGAGVDHAYELNIDGTPYVSAFPSGDALTGAGSAANLEYGTDPATTEGFVHISNEGPSPSPDGFNAQHSNYLESNPDDTPTQVQIDISDIIVGGMEDEDE